MNAPGAALISVIDFRRRGMVLDWHTADGIWTPCDSKPLLLHGIALIRASHPNLCVYAQAGCLYFQAGTVRYALSEAARLSCSTVAASLGFRRRFTIDAGDGKPPYTIGYWTTQHHDFLRWLSMKAASRDWRATCALRWSEGVAADALRSD